MAAALESSMIPCVQAKRIGPTLSEWMLGSLHTLVLDQLRVSLPDRGNCYFCFTVTTHHKTGNGRKQATGAQLKRATIFLSATSNVSTIMPCPQLQTQAFMPISDHLWPPGSEHLAPAPGNGEDEQDT
eukprot:scpid106778/ scgid19075/ 